MNVWDLIVLGLLLLLVAVAVVAMVRRRKKGKCLGCGGDCNNCTFNK